MAETDGKPLYELPYEQSDDFNQFKGFRKPVVDDRRYRVDNKGNFYDSCMFNDTPDTEYATFELDGEYISFSATLFVTRMCRENVEAGEASNLLWDTAEIIISGDEKVLYQKTGLDLEMEPEEIELDVTDIKELKIEFSDSSFVDENDPSSPDNTAIRPLFALGDAAVKWN